MADVSAALKDWSATSASNAPSGATTIGTGLDDNLREIQGAIVRGLSYKGADIASATTTDLGAVEGLMHDITGTTTITGFGTVRAGILKIIKFEGALTLTHNATSLILPDGINITTADGDVGVFISEGSGNWRCVSFTSVNIGLHSGRLVFGSNGYTSSIDAQVSKSATNGLVLQAATGSSYDFDLLNPGGGNAILRVATGTRNVEVPGGSVTGSSLVAINGITAGGNLDINSKFNANGTTGVVTSYATINVGSTSGLVAGGDTGYGFLLSSSQIGIYCGSGAPSISAPKGSLYLRSDGSTSSNRAYIAKDAVGGWAAISTAS